MVDTALVELGLQIKARREEVGISQAKLANLVGLTVVSVNRIENGAQAAPVDTLQRIAAHLGRRVRLELAPAEVVEGA